MPKLVLVTVPPHDRALAATARLRARQLFGGSNVPPSRGPERLQTSLKASYPDLVVREQDSLASRDSETVVWYVYRDGTAAASMKADRLALANHERAIEMTGRRRELRAALQGARETLDRARSITAASEQIAAQLRDRPSRTEGTPPGRRR